MLKLNERSKQNIQRHVGIPCENIGSMDISTIESTIEKKKGRRIRLLKILDRRLIGRGSVYLFLDRLLNMNTIDKKLSRI